MVKKYQIFISSTYTDLVEERKLVQDTILSMYHFPVGMELFSAADEDQWDVIKETIDSSDYYVLILAHRYGSIIQSGSDKGISYTEKEYRYAKSKGIPILAFIINPTASVKPEYIEIEHKHELEKFIADVKTGRIVKWWETKEELSRLVMNSLYKQFAKNKRPGWVRDTYNAESTLSEMVKLNQQIRDLTAENKQLKEELASFQKPHRSPKLTVSINVDTIDDALGNKCCPDYAIQDEETFIKGVKKLNISLFQEIKKKYTRIEMADFPDDLKPFAKQDEIDEYNASLPDDKELQRYVSSMEEYIQNTSSCVHINIGIHNDGNAKACNASAELAFPEGVNVFDDEILDLEEPVAPKKGKNPIQLAKNRKDNQFKFLLDISDSLANVVVPNYSPVNLRSIADIVADGIENYSLYDNMVDIECGDIIHTKSYWKRGIYLVGKKPGKYQIKCTLMCEEYEEPHIEYIDFEVQ